ncbi:hypothetical protein [Synechococcus sp. MIT S9220]|uniref:hypothetical protein n=1 Tax=Synechococcus sp. MIT S9220 TaxID=166309 RepID=UPI00164BF58A|nr:hypothetical protein [Synechococcus sp. MIT S9220]
MNERNPLKSYCPECGKQFGHAWQFVGLRQHLWEVHGIHGETTFNGKLLKWPKEDVSQ